MDRLLSEQDVIDAMAEALKHGEGVHNLLGRILAIPSAEPCEDAISRQDVLDLIEDMTDQFGIRHRVITEGVIKLLPSVKQEPKTVLYSGDGYADGYMVYDMAECPNCGYEYEEGDKDWGLPFCPNCGQSLNWESEDKE